MSKFVLFTDAERENIMQDVNDIVDDKHAVKNYPTEKFSNALRGIFKRGTSKKAMYDSILNAYHHDSTPIIQEDSLTAWANHAVENYGLEIRDIVTMKFGQKMNVMFLRRDMDSHNIGYKIDPRKKGFTYGIYIHGEGITGMLCTNNVDIRVPFTWEINVGTKDRFWGPTKDFQKLDPRTKIGLYGPAVNLADTKLLPKTVTFYGTWWNDEVLFRHNNYLGVRRTKTLTEE